MKFSLNAILGGLMVLALLSSCKKDDDSPDKEKPQETDMILINSAETDQGGMEVMIYANDSLTNSYNTVYIKVKDVATGKILTDADITITPMMDMGSMMHSAPSENPTGTAGTDQMFKGAVIFTMAADMGWTINVTVYDPVGDREGLAIIPVKVKATTLARTKVITPLDGSESLVISYLQPQSPKIGVNDMEITIHRKESMMMYAPVNDFTVHIDPKMIAMGHGSPNNVDPTPTENGHYKGKVNFTMSGNWRINLKLINGETVIDSTTYFDVTF